MDTSRILQQYSYACSKNFYGKYYRVYGRRVCQFLYDCETQDSYGRETLMVASDWFDRSWSVDRYGLVYYDCLWLTDEYGYADYYCLIDVCVQDYY